MKRCIWFCIALFSCHLATGQQDLYRWQLSGYTGIASYYNEENSTSDYFRINNNLLYRAELTRHLGSSLGLSLAYSLGEIRGLDQQQNRFTTDLHMAALRAYFYTDNGWFLNSSAIISPYLFGGIGLSNLETRIGGSEDESRYVPVIPVGIGLKFRIAERWRLAVQGEAVYPTERHLRDAAVEQNERNNAFLHAGVTLGYSFGFRKSDFNAPQFYSNNVRLLQSVEGQDQPRQNVLEMMLKLEPRKVQLDIPEDSTAFEQPDLVEREMVRPGDTLYTTTPAIGTDTAQVPQPQRVEPVPVEKAPVQDTTARAVEKGTAGQTGTDRDSLAVKHAVPAATDTVSRAVAVDTATQRQQAVTRQQLDQQRTTAEPIREPVRGRETRRVEERVVIAPVERNARTEAEITRLREEQQRLTQANKEIRQLQSRMDSLQKVQPAGENAPDAQTVRYLEQQAALNDALLQRLRQQEQELTLNMRATERPAVPTAPAASVSSSFAVFFPFNSHHVSLQSLSDINQLLQTLEENPDLQVRLTGYASRSGSAAYNLALSRKRAEALLNLLVEQGVTRDRISIAYMGDEKAADKESRMDRKVEVGLIR